MFYISAYFEALPAGLLRASARGIRDGDWNGWIGFFLGAIEEQAEENGRKAKEILGLYDEMKQTAPAVTPVTVCHCCADALFKTPIFVPSEFYEQSMIPKKTANRILQQLREQEIIAVLEEGSGSRATTYVFPRLIAITEGIGCEYSGTNNPVCVYPNPDPIPTTEFVDIRIPANRTPDAVVGHLRPTTKFAGHNGYCVPQILLQDTGESQRPGRGGMSAGDGALGSASTQRRCGRGKRYPKYTDSGWRGWARCRSIGG